MILESLKSHRTMIIQTWGDPSDLKKQENKQMKISV